MKREFEGGDRVLTESITAYVDSGKGPGLLSDAPINKRCKLPLTPRRHGK